MSDDWPKSNLFRGEEYLSALLLAMVLQHCESPRFSGQLDSYAITANADAMICCAEDGYIELTAAAGRRICAVVTPEGQALLERLRVELEKEDAAQQAWIERMIRDRPPALPKDKLTAEIIESPRHGLKPRKADET
jgi:hypothetical protein